MRFSAFISYTYADKDAATWLHRRLEAFRVPARIRRRASPVGTLGAKLPPVFRDRDELAASADLSAAVTAALEQSSALIVICSPRSARSRWVDQEVRTFAALGRDDRIMYLIVDGEPNAADPERECFPPAVHEGVVRQPLAADIRPGQDSKGDALLKLIAGLIDVSFDELRRREAARRQRRLTLIATASTFGLLIMSGLASFAWLSRNEAVEQRDVARQRTITAERTVRFVEELFGQGNPSEAQGREVTVREALAIGVKRVGTGLEEEPAVQAALGATFAQVYSSLGDYPQALAAIGSSLAIRHGDRAIRIRQLSILADVRRQIGDFDRAEQAARAAVVASGAASGIDPELVGRAYVVLGESLLEQGKDEEARAALNRAGAIYDAAKLGSSLDRALVHEDLARIERSAGNFAAAEQHIRVALPIRRTIEGPLSPSVSDNILALGQIAWQRGDNDRAIRLYRQRLVIDERTLGPNHPDVALILNNMARSLLEAKRFGEAEQLLLRALRIVVPRLGALNADAASIFFNTGLTLKGKGDLRGSADMFARALAAAEHEQLPMRSLTQIEVADVRCASGDVKAGEEIARLALPNLQTDYAGDPWRAAWGRLVLASCMAAAGKQKEARSLARPQGSILQERWKRGTFFGDLATEHLRRIG